MYDERMTLKVLERVLDYIESNQFYDERIVGIVSVDGEVIATTPLHDFIVDLKIDLEEDFDAMVEDMLVRSTEQEAR